MAQSSVQLQRKHAILFYIVLGGVTAAIISRFGFVNGLLISLPMFVVAALLMRLVFGKVE